MHPMVQTNTFLDQSSEPAPVPAPSLVVLVESLLFVASEPVGLDELTRALEAPVAAVEAALATLEQLCHERGVRLQRHAGRVQLVTAPEAARAIGRFLGTQASGRLSNAALEVLAIIAYRQPLTRAEIEAIRGVDSSATVRALLARDLIAEAGRRDTLGRPILYTTTNSFLQQFGLSNLSELPALDLPGLSAEPPHVDEIAPNSGV